MVNGQHTYWRNDGEAFWYHCGGKYMMWAVTAKDNYAAKMECRGWATAKQLPTEKTDGIEVAIEGGAFEPAEDATADISPRKCSAPDHLDEDAQAKCMQISRLSGADGHYQA